MKWPIRNPLSLQNGRHRTEKTGQRLFFPLQDLTMTIFLNNFAVKNKIEEYEQTEILCRMGRCGRRSVHYVGGMPGGCEGVLGS